MTVGSGEVVGSCGGVTGTVAPGAAVIPMFLSDGLSRAAPAVVEAGVERCA